MPLPLGEGSRIGAPRRARTCNMPLLRRPPLPIGLPARTRGRLRTCTVRRLRPGLFRLGYAGKEWCARRDSNSHCSRSERDASCQLGYRRMVLSAGFDPAASDIPSRCSTNEPTKRLPPYKSGITALRAQCLEEDGAGRGDQTSGLRFTRAALYQLSYASLEFSPKPEPLVGPTGREALLCLGSAGLCDSIIPS